MEKKMENEMETVVMKNQRAKARQVQLQESFDQSASHAKCSPIAHSSRRMHLYCRRARTAIYTAPEDKFCPLGIFGMYSSILRQDSTQQPPIRLGFRV